MTKARLFLTLMSKDYSDKIIGFLANSKLKISAASSSGLTTYGEDDSLSYIMALDIEVPDDVEENITKKLKEENKKTDCNTIPSYLSDKIKEFLKNNSINYFSYVFHNVNAYGAIWNNGNVKKPNAKDIRKLRQEEKEEEE